MLNLPAVPLQVDAAIFCWLNDDAYKASRQEWMKRRKETVLISYCALGLVIVVLSPTRHALIQPPLSAVVKHTYRGGVMALDNLIRCFRA